MGGILSSPPTVEQFKYHDQFAADYHSLLDQLELLTPGTTFTHVSMDLYVDTQAKQYTVVSHSNTLYHNSPVHMGDFVLTRTYIWHSTSTVNHGMVWHSNRPNDIVHYTMLYTFLSYIQQFIDSMYRMTIICQSKDRPATVRQILKNVERIKPGETTSTSKAALADILTSKWK